MDTFYSIMSILLIAFVFVHLWATVMIGLVARASEWMYPALNERFVTGVIQSISAVSLGALGANRLLGWHWSPEAVLLLLATALLIKVVPSFVWLYLFYTDGFHADGSIKDSAWKGKEE